MPHTWANTEISVSDKKGLVQQIEIFLFWRYGRVKTTTMKIILKIQPTQRCKSMILSATKSITREDKN